MLKREFDESEFRNEVEVRFVNDLNEISQNAKLYALMQLNKEEGYSGKTIMRLCVRFKCHSNYSHGNSLNNMELYVVLKLKELARDPPSNDDIMHLLQGKTIDRKCRVSHLKYWGHVMRRPVDHVLRKALTYHAPGKLKRGRPCFTWHTSLNRAIYRSRQVNWHTTVLDKNAHNKKCDELFLPSQSDDSD